LVGEAIFEPATLPKKKGKIVIRQDFTKYREPGRLKIGVEHQAVSPVSGRLNTAMNGIVDPSHSFNTFSKRFLVGSGVAVSGIVTGQGKEKSLLMSYSGKP